MATGNFVLDKGYDASAAITKFRAVKFTGAETVGPVTAATDAVAGIAQFGVTADEITNFGKGASIRVMGASEMEASEAITVGQLVSITTDGRAQVASAGERQIGHCVEAASDAGARCRVQLSLPGTLVA